jgi:PAS domain S-box-containing protein
MITIDLRTVFFNYMLTNIVSLIVMIILWQQSRKRFEGTIYLLIDFVFQLLCLFLIFLRGHIPDFISIDVSNTLAVSGAVLGFIGLEYFTGKKSRQIHNYLLIAAFFAIHVYFTFIQPDLAIRNLNSALAYLIISLQCAWLLLKRVPVNLRGFTLNVGFVFVLFCVVNIIRVIEFFISKHLSNDYFHTGGFETFVIISYQLLFILLTFSLALMINKRLLKEITTQEEKFSKAFHSVPYAIIITQLSDGRLLEVNDGFEKITNFSANEVIGKTTIELDIWLNDKDREFVVNTLLKHEKVEEMEFQFHKKTGEKLTGLLSSEIIFIDNEKCILSVINDITVRKQSENALNESEAKYRTLFTQMSEGFALHEVVYDETHIAVDYKIININPAFEKQVGIPAEKANGALASELYGVSPAPYLEVYAHVAETSEPNTFHSYFQPLDQYYDISVFSPIPGFFATIFTNITERKRAEEALRETKDYLENLLNYANAPIIVWDDKYRITQFNKAFERLSGRNVAEVIGKEVDILFPAASKSQSLEYIQKASRGDRWEVVEIDIQHIDNSIHTLLWNSAAIYSPDRNLVVATIAQGQDITTRKQAEKALKESEIRLRELNVTKDKFFSIIAHDLKSPFNSILGLSDLLSEQIKKKDYTGIDEYAAIIQNSSQRVMDLLSNLLEWSRSQTGRIEFNPEYTEMIKLINEVIELSSDTLRQKSISISRELPLKAIAFADKAMVSTVLRNLLSNAIKFTNPNGEIVISASIEPKSLLISVCDNGIGIKKDHLEKLFLIGESNSTLGTQNEKGTGLGLILCKEFVEKHGGKIWAESDPDGDRVGKGSTFFFTLPLK